MNQQTVILATLSTATATALWHYVRSFLAKRRQARNQRRLDRVIAG